MVVTLVVNDDDRVAIRIVDAVQCGTERGYAQRQEEKARGASHHPRRQPQQFPHHCQGTCRTGVAVKSVHRDCSRDIP